MEAPVSHAKEETAVPAKPGQPAKVRLDDSVLIRVKSNTYGQLIYVNKRTGDRTEWRPLRRGAVLSPWVTSGR